jgi:hypothetical protein
VKFQASSSGSSTSKNSAAGHASSPTLPGKPLPQLSLWQLRLSPDLHVRNARRFWALSYRSYSAVSWLLVDQADVKLLARIKRREHAYEVTIPFTNTASVPLPSPPANRLAQACICYSDKMSLSDALIRIRTLPALKQKRRLCALICELSTCLTIHQTSLLLRSYRVPPVWLTPREPCHSMQSIQLVLWNDKRTL